jgi:hypothetical protein
VAAARLWDQRERSARANKQRELMGIRWINK